jgi:hypothetical protein
MLQEERRHLAYISANVEDEPERAWVCQSLEVIKKVDSHRNSALTILYLPILLKLANGSFICQTERTSGKVIFHIFYSAL